MVDRLATSIVASSKPGAATVTRKSSFSYKGIAGGSCTGGAIGQLCSETIEPDRASESGSAYGLWQQTSYGYDTRGNRTTGTVTFKERDGTQVSNRSPSGVLVRARGARSRNAAVGGRSAASTAAA